MMETSELKPLLLAVLLPLAFAAEPLTQKFYPQGGGNFEITLSACSDNAAILNGRLVNNTDTTWLYVEIQVKITQGTTSTKYRINLERIGAEGKAIRQRIDGATVQDCGSIRLSGLELIAAYSEERAVKKKL